MHFKRLSAFAALSFFSLAQTRPGSALASSVNDASISGTSGTPGAVSSDIWCGFVQKSAVESVSAVWVVPNVSLPDSGSQGDYEIFQWVGIDGAGPSRCSTVLLQGGTSQVFDKGQYTTDFWYEFYNPQQQPSLHVTYPPLQIGDQVRVTVTATSPYAGNIFFENLTRNTSDRQYVKSALPLCFEHVEWISEAPTKQLPNFEDFEFTQVSAVKYDGTSINGDGSEYWYINTPVAKCHASLQDGGSTIGFSQS